MLMIQFCIALLTLHIQPLKTLQQAFDELQHALFNLILVFNANKTRYMVLIRPRDIRPHWPWFTHHNFDRTQHLKSLWIQIPSIWLDEEFTFQFHTDTLARKLRHKTGFLHRNKSNFPVLNKKQITKAVCLSVLHYGDVVYRNASASTLVPLNFINHCTLSSITGDSYFTHHCILYEKLGWAPINVWCDRHCFLFLKF